ncbi:MAG: indole-3-glycerol phosphate synthase TrpC [Rickettsiales bacterium]|nr:indole-3-glycerol phosphate synthase TrpC [Rickettsiales bacterium]
MMQMDNVLKRICDDKEIHIARRQEMLPLARVKEIITENDDFPRPFLGRIKNAVDKKQTALIAEIKKSSPSRGTIREDFDPASLALAYQEGGACCLSILTDINYFGGKDDYIKDVKSFCSLPILRKDFILNPYQIYESRAIGADAILLIKSILSTAQINQFAAIADQLKMAVLLEVHNEKEMEEALKTDIPLIGINNRDLKTFKVSLNTTLELAPKLRKKKKIVVCESGIKTNADIQRISKATKTYSFLVGESLMREKDVETATRKLLRG